jgi:NADH dehydrogenase
MWLFVHIAFLTGFKNRLSALFHWGATFLASSRAERTITLRQVIGRVAIEQGGGDDLTGHLIVAPEQHDDPGPGRAASSTTDHIEPDKG